MFPRLKQRRWCLPSLTSLSSSSRLRLSSSGLLWCHSWEALWDPAARLLQHRLSHFGEVVVKAVIASLEDLNSVKTSEVMREERSCRIYQRMKKKQKKKRIPRRPSPPWSFCRSWERSRTSRWNPSCHRVCQCLRAAAGRATWWTGSPPRCAPSPPSAACRKTRAGRRGSSARPCRTPPPAEEGEGKRFRPSRLQPFLQSTKMWQPKRQIHPERARKT